MPYITICEEADEELLALYDHNEDAAATFDVLLEQLDNDKEMLDRLFRPANHFLYRPPFEIKQYEAMQRTGRNIFIIKVRGEDGELLPWRLLIGFDSRNDVYHVLCLAPRSIAYDESDPLFRIVQSRYDNAGLPTH